MRSSFFTVRLCCQYRDSRSLPKQRCFNPSEEPQVSKNVFICVSACGSHSDPWPQTCDHWSPGLWGELQCSPWPGASTIEYLMMWTTHTHTLAFTRTQRLKAVRPHPATKDRASTQHVCQTVAGQGQDQDGFLWSVNIWTWEWLALDKYD